jgi:hypothetical protein
MAESTVNSPGPVNIGGGLRSVSGTITQAAFAGTDVVTGLQKVLHAGVAPSTNVKMTAKESATAGTITIYAENDGVDSGTWFAVGW